MLEDGLYGAKGAAKNADRKITGVIDERVIRHTWSVIRTAPLENGGLGLEPDRDGSEWAKTIEAARERRRASLSSSEIASAAGDAGSAAGDVSAIGDGSAAGAEISSEEPEEGGPLSLARALSVPLQGKLAKAMSLGPEEQGPGGQEQVDAEELEFLDMFCEEGDEGRGDNVDQQGGNPFCLPQGLQEDGSSSTRSPVEEVDPVGGGPSSTEEEVFLTPRTA